MDEYGLSVDDLLDLPNDDFLTSSSSSSAAATDFLHHNPYSSTTATATYYDQSSFPGYSTDFSNILCAVPSDDAAELEWLSTYMDDSFTDFPANELTKSDAVFHGRPRSKRCSRPPSTTTETNPIANNVGGGVATDQEVVRRCTHCASEKTPQWRTGPVGPKTLCNACGVRYKSGRLVPEYRPAASPTFVLTQHSNSHRKVLELRRQKEVLRQQQEGRGRHFPVC